MPRQGIDVVVDRCIRRLHWASKEVQPAATAAMLRILGNGFSLPARFGHSQRCPLCGYEHAGSIQHIVIDCSWWQKLQSQRNWGHISQSMVTELVGNFWTSTDKEQASVFRLALILGRLLYEACSCVHSGRHFKVADLVHGAMMH
eukprot:5535648-Amphidinium_carterae.2